METRWTWNGRSKLSLLRVPKFPGSALNTRIYQSIKESMQKRTPECRGPMPGAAGGRRRLVEPCWRPGGPRSPPARARFLGDDPGGWCASTETRDGPGGAMSCRGAEPRILDNWAGAPSGGSFKTVAPGGHLPLGGACVETSCSNTFCFLDT